jgi:CubicO group peptidase (beta-lactamase class C family)
MDSAKIFTGLQQIRNTPALQSVLVIKNDSLVVEYYTLGFIKDNDFHVGAISAAVTSALVGLALDQRMIRSVNDGVFEYLPAIDGAGDDPRKRTWTIEHFLTMRAGVEWNEYNDHSHLYNSSTNWVSVSLGLPVKYAPGDTFIFASPFAHLLSAIITRASRMSTYNFAKQFLFDPLGISVRSWSTDPQGVFLGGSGMRFTPRDLARFGQLYLHKGYLGGKQIVPRSWIEQSLTPRNRYNSVKGDLASLNFGYLWWTSIGGGDSLFAAFGYGGQAIYVVPSRSMIIVTIADDTVARLQAEENELAVLAIVRKYFF